MSFTESQILQLNVKAEQMWNDSAIKKPKIAHVDAVKAIMANQTASFEVLDDPEKDLKIKVMFLSLCAIEDEACEDNCNIDEQEGASNSKEYDPDLCRKTGFKINEKILRTNQYRFEELFAEFSAKALDALDEFWAKQAMAKLKEFAGINVAPSPYTYDATAKTTNVPSENYNLTMLPKLIRQSMLNELGETYFIDDGSLWEYFFNAQINAGNGEGKGDKRLIDEVNVTFDHFNFAKAGLSENTFAISKSAVAMKTVNKFPDTPRTLTSEGQRRYTMASRNLEGVKYDVIHQEKCIGDDIFHTFRFITNGGIWLNPEGCPVTIDGNTATPTGVLSYTAV